MGQSPKEKKFKIMRKSSWRVWCCWAGESDKAGRERNHRAWHCLDVTNEGK